MTTVRKPDPCTHADHAPKKEVLEVGKYVHTCDGCGEVEHFEITLSDYRIYRKLCGYCGLNPNSSGCQRSHP